MSPRMKFDDDADRRQPGDASQIRIDDRLGRDLVPLFGQQVRVQTERIVGVVDDDDVW